MGMSFGPGTPGQFGFNPAPYVPPQTTQSQPQPGRSFRSARAGRFATPVSRPQPRPVNTAPAQPPMYQMPPMGGPDFWRSWNPGMMPGSMPDYRAMPDWSAISLQNSNMPMAAAGAMYDQANSVTGQLPGNPGNFGQIQQAQPIAPIDPNLNQYNLTDFSYK